MEATQDCYQDVPAEQWNRLVRFRESHPPKRIEVGGLGWEYIACGQGAATLLLLPGGLRRAETAFPQIRMFEGTHRLITPGYPPATKIDHIVAGVVDILDREGVTRASVLGQSYGGMVAQVLIQSHPKRVDRLVLSSSGPLRASRGMTTLLSVLTALAAVLPGPVVRGLFKRSLQRILSVPESESRFWRAYLEELFSLHLSKADVLSHFLTGQDVLRRYAYAEKEKSQWEGAVLIIGGEKDPVSTEADRNALKEVFPQAEVRVVEGCGHTPALEKPGIYAALILDFLGRLS